MTTCMHPVYVDGPLRGQDFAVDGRSAFVQAIDYGAEITLAASVAITSRTVTYRLRQYGIFGRIIWVGSLADEPRLEDLADLLLSPAAKTAGRQVLPDLRAAAAEAPLHEIACADTDMALPAADGDWPRRVR